MAAKIFALTKDMDRESWLESRKNGLGGSDIAAIAGLSRWKSPLAVYLEKTGQYENNETNEAMQIGTELEDWVAEKFVREFEKDSGNKVKIQRKNAMLQHSEYPFMLANIDREIIDKNAGRGILECKTASEYMLDEWEDGTEEGRVPDSYMLQVQHYLAVTGYDWAFIAVLIGGNKFRYRYIPRDEEMIAYLIKIESDFWKLVENKTPPAIDGLECTKDLLGKLYPDSKPGSIDLPPEASKWLQDREYWKKQVDDAQLRLNEAENQIKNTLGDNEIGWHGERKVTWKTVLQNRIDSKRLKAEQPEIYKAYVNESKSRRFTVK